MSFRNRLSLFFVLIVIVPMVSLTVVLFRLLADNENGKADARLGSRQESVLGLYSAAKRDADKAAVQVAKDPALDSALQQGDRAAAAQRASVLLKTVRAKRIVVRAGGKTLLDAGAGNAVFPAERELLAPGGKSFGDLEVSVTGPRNYATLVKRVTGMDVVVRGEGRVLTSTLPSADGVLLPQHRGDVAIDGKTYRSASFSDPGFGEPTQTAVLDSSHQKDSDIRSSRLVGGLIIVGFLVIAFFCALLVSRTLQRQIEELLKAARRLGRGDFSAEVPTVGNDEFAALGVEFNNMSSQLEQKIAELQAERERLALSMRRIGETFASNLDRDALLEIVVRTAVDGVDAGGGRAQVRRRPESQLHQITQAGSLDDLLPALKSAEAAVLETGAAQTATADGVHALAYPLRAARQDGADGPPRLTGVVSLARAGARFSDAQRELFDYLAGQASVSIENVGLHETVERQATTDELTSLSNRRRFMEALSGEVERGKRFEQSVSLVMLDIDNFKKVNDTYGHQAGDLVLREVAKVLRDNSREIDEPSRYGGEELAVVLPQTDLDGAVEVAERVRTGIAELRLPIGDPEDGPFLVTASFGAASYPSSAAEPHGLIAACDAALYEAKEAGKNRTVRARPDVQTG